MWKRYRAEIIATALAMALLLPLCGVLFGCGCTFTTGLKHCNIHDPAPPNCPWCSGSLAIQLVPMIAISLAAFAGPLLFRKGAARHFALDLALGLLCALVTAVIVGWIYALAWDYPNFFL